VEANWKVCNSRGKLNFDVGWHNLINNYYLQVNICLAFTKYLKIYYRKTDIYHFTGKWLLLIKSLLTTFFLLVDFIVDMISLINEKTTYLLYILTMPIIIVDYQTEIWRFEILNGYFKVVDNTYYVYTVNSLLIYYTFLHLYLSLLYVLLHLRFT